MFDEELLRRLSESPEVQQSGRSEVVRRAVHSYLRQRECERISESYKRAYSQTTALDHEFSGWSEEGEWPEE